MSASRIEAQLAAIDAQCEAQRRAIDAALDAAQRAMIQLQGEGGVRRDFLADRIDVDEFERRIAIALAIC